MLRFIGIVALVVAVAVAPVAYNQTGPQRCEASYDTSFNGLWLIKTEHCFGRLGMESSSREIARKALFERF